MAKSMGHFRDSRALSWLLYPSIDTIICDLLKMPAASITAKMSFSVLRRLKTCISSAMKNDRLYSLGLMHLHIKEAVIIFIMPVEGMGALRLILLRT
jgi:hypothetical protein